MYNMAICIQNLGFLASSAGKESTCNAGDPGSIPVLGRSPGEAVGYPLHYSWAFWVAQMVKHPLAMQETWLWSLGWDNPLEESMATHSSILAWRISMDRGARWATVHWVTKSLMWLSTVYSIFVKCKKFMIAFIFTENIFERDTLTQSFLLNFNSRKLHNFIIFYIKCFSHVISFTFYYRTSNIEFTRALIVHALVIYI